MSATTTRCCLERKMLEAFSTPFMQRALIAGILVAFLAGYYGVFVVQRGLSFLGVGLAHATFGGVALALLLQEEPLFIAAPFTVAVAIGITWLRDRTNLGADTAVGIFFAVSMALGIVFLSLKENYSSEVHSYLFGSILAVTGADLWATTGVLIAALMTFPVWNRWAYATFDYELASASRLPVRRDDYLLSVMIAITVVVSVKLMGIILVAAYLVVPAASARLLSRSFFSMTLWAIGLGITGTCIGLVISYHLDIPSGATIILTQAAFFFVLALVKR